MQKAPINFQDTFLAKTRRAGTLVTVFLMNGFQMHGTIIPMRPIDFNATGD